MEPGNDKPTSTGGTSVSMTITEIRDALAASEQRLHGVLETAVNAIVIINEKGVMDTVNRAAERVFGYTREEMLGRNVSMLMPSPYAEKHNSYLRNYITTGEKKIIGIGREAIGRRKDGSVFPIDLSVGEVQMPDGRRVFTGIIRDLSERKELEEKILRISEEEQHRIGQDIHDDLCQQLAAISCLAKVAHQKLKARGAAEADDCAEIVRMITNANTRAREMSRGLMPVVLDSAGLMDALDELASSTERVFRVSCPFHCDPPVQVTDNTIAVQLYRIAQEAVANALKHSHADRIEITLRRENGFIVLHIRDNGIGIPDHSPGRGTGMGLLTMTRRARMLGGTLDLENSESGGTLVRCRLPVPPSQSPARRK